MTPSRKIAYITREIERALGMEPGPNYIIVSNKTKYGQTLKNKYPDALHLVESSTGELLGTGELANAELTKKVINPDCSILVFKNTTRVETVLKNNNWAILNPAAYLSERVENKLTQLRWLGPLAAKYLPSHTAKLTKLITWKSTEPFIVQWAHGHTGDGTTIIRTMADLQKIQEKFPERMARVSSYVSGPSFTVNVVVAPNKILMGNISYQITGLAPFTDNEFTTIGNDWSVVKTLLPVNAYKYVQEIVSDIGNKLQTDGWRGLFGIDLIYDENRNKLYLIEINARQPASATFESQLQENARQKGAKGLTTFEAHIKALLSEEISDDLLKIEQGAQIVQRVTKNTQGLFDDVTEKLEKLGFGVISYQNSEPNSDLVRIQSNDSIMSGHNSWSESGQKILEVIKGSQIKLGL